MVLSPEQFDKALKEVQRLRQSRPVLNVADHELASASLPYLVGKLLGELREYIEACEQECEGVSSQEAVHNQVAEWMDVLIYLLIIFKETKIYPDLGLLTTVQSEAHRPDNLIAAMQACLLVMEQGITRQKLDHVMEIWQLVAAYLPPDLRVAVAVANKQVHNGWNRPRAYYQDHDATGQRLTEAEIHDRYYHSERCLRLIRDYFTRVCGRKVELYSWMHQPFAKYILDFRHSKASYESLRWALERSGPIYQQLMREVASQLDVTREEKLLIALAAGGQALGVVPEPVPQDYFHD